MTPVSPRRVCPVAPMLQRSRRVPSAVGALSQAADGHANYSQWP